MIPRIPICIIASLLLFITNPSFTTDSGRYRSSSAESVTKLRVREGFGHTYRGEQHRGEMLLHLLARKAEQEDAWIYTGEVWIDIGHDERPNGVLCCWEAIHCVSAFPIGEHLVWYHIHPVQNEQPDRIHPPSSVDIFALARLKELADETYGSRLTGKVFDGFGVWSVDLSEEFLQRLFPASDQENCAISNHIDPRDVVKLMGSPKRRGELARLAFLLDYEERIRRIVDNPHLERNQQIENFVIDMNEIGVLLKYTKLD